MAESKPYTVRWGILATGGIAKTFTKDLLVDPSTRDVLDVRHTVVAAASSTSKDRAEAFLKECNVPSGATAYGSYAELVADPSVDIIYVATPHSHHYQNTMLCLKAGKNVLCEKAFTVNAAQAKLLVEEAKKRRLFLMEAVWTRYFPISVELREMVKQGKIGTLQRVFADLSIGEGEKIAESFKPENRMVNLDLAGGALLDLGIYSITWVFQFLYHLQPAGSRRLPSVASSITKYPVTGADEMTSMIFTFPSDPPTHGIATTALRPAHDPDKRGTAGPAIRIQGTRGEIQVFGPAYRPTKYRLVFFPGHGESPVDVEKPIPGGHGMMWEADECARCLRDGKLESEGLGWEESVVIMEVMDEVRRQGGLVYPERIESTEYPLEGF
ncbi:NAD(P)-binding protein [Patellaria atrata CBS 101060]|uniref:D-xylose 1-dehydrogenase (NADP(+), D-xylono-1,5-lactone-forming) n=1 Tax=Patellaria atrata CBS 101060 TaxID=1346257 RepID=A0A9P4S6M0_9PEZI|nr:NAD(P)-binding protein [Patellaria atrata CBS 101060]